MFISSSVKIAKKKKSRKEEKDSINSIKLYSTSQLRQKDRERERERRIIDKKQRQEIKTVERRTEMIEKS